MEAKHLFALNVLFSAALVGLLFTIFYQKARDLAFFLLVGLAVVTDRLDVHFFSSEWYRGSTRGFELSLLDVAAFCLLVSSWIAPRYGKGRWYWPASLGILLLYLVYAGFSVATSQPKLFGMFELTKIVRGILIFLAAALFVRSKREVSILLAALAIDGCLEGFLAVKEQYLDGVYRVTGTLGHPNSLSMYLCTIGPVLVAGACADFSKWLQWLCRAAIAATAVGIMLTYSRAGVPIFALCMMGATAWIMSWKVTPTKALVGLVLIVAASVFVCKSWGSLMRRYQEDTLADEYLDETGTAEGRGIYLRWANAIAKDHFFGVGLNNWSYWVARLYGPRFGYPFEDYDEMQIYTLTKESLPYYYLPAPAHNLGALTVGELGIPGLAIFLCLWGRWFLMGARFLRRRSTDAMHATGTAIFFGTCGIFMQSMTEWTYRQTAILFTFHLMLGTLASLCHARSAARKEERAPPEPDRLPEPETFEALPAGRG